MTAAADTAFARAGSQRWLQVLLDRRPDLLRAAFAEALGRDVGAIDWVSPKRDDGFREYRDMEALRLLGVDTLPIRSLASFWPARGPVWDALGRASSGELFFVEAKAHAAEAASPSSKASPESMKKIRDSLAEVRRVFAPRSEADWSATFYQYANRLAHLYLFRQINELPAHLVFIYFLNVSDVRGRCPKTPDEWHAAIVMLRAALGLEPHPLDAFVHDLFIDVTPLLGEV